MMRYYTVLGLESWSGEVHIAAVLEGKHEPVDNNDTRGYSRRFFHVRAADPDEAEKFALEDAQ